MNWTITPYKPQHTTELRRIFLEARQLAFPWIDASTFKLLDFDEAIQGEILLVALNHNMPIGFIAWWPPDNFVHSLFIDPSFIGRGVGKLLLQACLEQIGRPASLKCLKANKKALGFYHSQGWEISTEGESPDGPFYLLTIK